MRKVQRWRYYCDHCKKAGGSSGHMARHERGCTANPNRVCGVCAKLGLTPEPLQNLVAFVRSRAVGHNDPVSDYDWSTIDQKSIDELREKAAQCPCCMLAALRQTGAHPQWDAKFEFKEELKSLWRDLGPQAERRERDYYGGMPC